MPRPNLHDWFCQHLACMLTALGHETDAAECSNDPRMVRDMLTRHELANVGAMAKATSSQSAEAALLTYEWYMWIMIDNRWATNQAPLLLGHFGAAGFDERPACGFASEGQHHG